MRFLWALVLVLSIAPATSLAVPPAAPGNALSFDGGDFAVLPNSSVTDFLDTNAWTLEFWSKRTSTPGVYHVLGKRSECSGGGIQYMMARDGTGFGFGGGNCGLHVSEPPQGVWTHLAFTHNGTGTPLRCYVNGSLAALTTCSGMSEVATDLLIGTAGTCAGFQGQIDELRIWNIARTPEQVLYSYDCTVDPDTSTGLVGYWKFDDNPQSQVIFDSSPTKSHGILGSSVSVDVNDPARVPSDAPLACALVSVPSWRPSSSDFLRLGVPRPNPSPGPTELVLGVGRATYVELAIYDVVGARVQTLVSAVYAAGEHRVRWDGKDATGIQVRAGVYFLAARTAGVSIRRVIVVTR